MVLETDRTSYRAAQYVRMSTEHQQYSTNNQADKILEYAQRRNIEIVRTYADNSAEDSGLSAELKSNTATAAGYYPQSSVLSPQSFPRLRGRAV